MQPTFNKKCFISPKTKLPPSPPAPCQVTGWLQKTEVRNGIRAFFKDKTNIMLEEVGRQGYVGRGGAEPGAFKCMWGGGGGVLMSKQQVNPK